MCVPLKRCYSPEIRVKTVENKAKALRLSVPFSRAGAEGYTGGVE